METTAGQLLINSLLPADLRDYDRVLTKSELSNLLKEVAKKYPERYEQIVSGMTRLGGKIVRRTGGLSFGLDDLAPTPSVLESRLKVKAEVRKILTDPDRTPGQKRTAIADFLNSQQKSLEDSVYKESLEEQSPLAHQVLSGARGSKTNLKTLRAGDLLYVDNRERPIPIPIDRSYSEGLRPAQYFAATYGARKGVLDNKLATADSGFFSKQLNQAVHRLLVTGRDEDEDERLDPDEVRPIRGLPVDTDDPDNEGALLAQDFGPYKRNTPLTPKILAHLKDNGYDKILVRSPMATNNPDGVYSRDVGIREDGNLARRGQFSGLLAASSLAEPLTQGMLCLAAGTMVRMAHGGAKPIEKIKFGNYVLGCDKEGRTFPVKVIGTFDNGPRECLRTQFHNVQTNERVEVICTAEHKILAEYRVKAAEQTVGPCQIHVSKEAELFWALLPKTGGLAERTCQKNMGVFLTYDIEVDHPDHLFVLENGLAVSNSSKHCLSEGQPVCMADGTTRAVEQIVPGDLVLGADKTGKTFPVPVTHVFDNGEQDCVQYGFKPNSRDRAASYLPTVVCTPNHRVLVHNNGSEMREIGKVPKALKLQSPTGRLDEADWVEAPEALLVGLLLGDGCYTEAVGGVHFSCADLGLIEELGPYLGTLNLKLTKLKGHPYYYRVSSLVEPKAERCPVSGQVLPGRRNPARLLVERLGMWGRYSYEKELPACVFGWNNASVLQLLAGLYITDGSFFLACRRRYLVCSFASTSLKMAQQVQSLLQDRFGIGSQITGNATSRKRKLYLTKITRGYDVRRLVDMLPLLGLKRETVQTLRPHLDNVLRQEPFGWKIAYAEPVGLRRTYDLRVDHPDHLYVLPGGIIVSNSGGVAGQAKSVGGFQLINQLAQAPKKFPGGATHAQRDGKVRAIQPAPQGGLYVFVDDEKHYIPQGFNPQVKIGDEIEAGDQLSDGLPHPGELVKFKGVGEGRRVWMQQFQKAYKDSGLKANRRNVEMVARGIVNHVRMTEEHGRWVPDDVVPYNVMERSWTPREGAVEQAPQAAIGGYLERPVLHYTVGTRVRPSVAKTLQQFKIPKITTHKSPPPFQPEMVRAMENMSHDEDWMTRMLGSYQQRSLLESVHRGLSSDPKGTSFVPALANPKDFGRQGYTASVLSLIHI